MADAEILNNIFIGRTESRPENDSAFPFLLISSDEVVYVA